MRIKWIVIGALGVIVLSSCSLTPPKSMMDVQANETFVLNQRLIVPANVTRVFIQHGKLTSRHDFNRLEQHCELEVYKLTPYKQTIMPDDFTISKVRIGSEMVAAKANEKNLMVAEANTGLMTDTQQPWQAWLADNTDNERVETMDLVRLYLKPTTKNPNIFRLTCSGSLSNGDILDAPRSYRPQRAQINQILGSIGHLN